MATMPLVAQEPWRHAEQFAKQENDLFKMFQDQAFRAEQADLTRAQQNNMQQNQFSQADAIQGRNFDFQRGMQNDRFNFSREMAESGGGELPRNLVERMRNKMVKLTSMGIPQDIAAGLAGNIAQESKFDPRIVGDGGRSIGLYQFNENGELPALRAFAKERGLDINDEDTQNAFVWHQLNGPYRATLDKMIAAKDPALAAEIFSREYERPHPKYAMNDRRRRYATQAFTLYGVRPSEGQAQAPADGNVPAPVAGGQQQSAAAPAQPNKSGAGTMPNVNKGAPGGSRVEKVIGPDGVTRYKLVQG